MVFVFVTKTILAVKGCLLFGEPGEMLIVEMEFDLGNMTFERDL